MSASRPLSILLAALALTAAALLATPAARAEPFANDGGAEWRLEQPEAPVAPPGVERPSWLVGLGHVGDIEFDSPNRGALITAGNGSTVPAGVWLYNGVHWRELSTVCGATDGRIAWAGPDEFWTVSDGRPGQAPDSNGNLPNLHDVTLCHFAAVKHEGQPERFEVVGSYATLAFQSTSYLPMHGAVCRAPNDCWFGGDPLRPPGEGAFQLHWDGASMTEVPYIPEGHAVEEMRVFEESIFQSLKILPTDTRVKQEPIIPPLRRILPGTPAKFESLTNVPLTKLFEPPQRLEPAHLGADGQSLWAAAGPSKEGAEAASEPGVTIARYSKLEWVPVLGEFVQNSSPSWSSVIGPETTPDGVEVFGSDTVPTAIAAEPGTQAAWVALNSRIDAEETSPSPNSSASLARVGADNTVTDRVSLPEGGGAVGPRGAGAHLACPAAHDCWLVTTQGWLFHLSNGEEPGGPPDEAFAELPGETAIDTRPIDEGVPQSPPDTVPEDISGEGLNSLQQSIKQLLTTIPSPFATITLPLVSRIHVKVVHRTTLELSFHLAVKARIRLVARRGKNIVAATRRQVLKAGNHTLKLQLDPKRWPTKLKLEEKALAPLPTTTTRESNTGTIGTSERSRVPLTGSWDGLS
jgi:hypothetical protein